MAGKDSDLNYHPQESEVSSKRPEEPEIKQSVNNLLPEILLKEEELGALRDKSTEELKLTVRVYNCLKRAGIERLGQVFGMKRADLLYIRNLKLCRNKGIWRKT